jgi:hypothetical protein
MLILSYHYLRWLVNVWWSSKHHSIQFIIPLIKMLHHRMICHFKFHCNIVRNSIGIYQGIISVGIFMDELYHQVYSIDKTIGKNYTSSYFCSFFYSFFFPLQFPRYIPIIVSVSVYWKIQQWIILLIKFTLIYGRKFFVGIFI